MSVVVTKSAPIVSCITTSLRRHDSRRGVGEKIVDFDSDGDLRIRCVRNDFELGFAREDLRDLVKALDALVTGAGL